MNIKEDIVPPNQKNKQNISEDIMPLIQRKKRDYQYGKGATEYYKQRLESQQGLCDACGEPMSETPHLDHNHLTGKWRGLLHDGCNKALGFMSEDSKHLRLLADYLDRWEGEHNVGV